MIDYGFGVRLGTIEKENLEKLRQWRNDPEIMRWCRQNDLIDGNHHEKWFYSQSSRQDIRMYLIRSCSSSGMNDVVLGVCGLTDLDFINRRAEFSCYIAPGYQGKGFATAALKTLFTHGFRAYNLHQIWGETYEGNPAARIFQKIGMTNGGSRRDYYFRDGRYINADLYSVLRSEWDCLLHDWGEQKTQAGEKTDSQEDHSIHHVRGHSLATSGQCETSA